MLLQLLEIVFWKITEFEELSVGCGAQCGAWRVGCSALIISLLLMLYTYM